MAATCATASPTAARSPSSSAASASASASSAAPAAPRSALPAGPAAPPGLHPAQDRALVNTGAINALAALPAARSPALRSPRSLNMDRSSNREALLAQCCGVVSAAPCAHCAKGSGPWTDCVVVAGLLGGSCANCHFGGSGARCSLRGDCCSSLPPRPAPADSSQRLPPPPRPAAPAVPPTAPAPPLVSCSVLRLARTMLAVAQSSRPAPAPSAVPARPAPSSTTTSLVSV